MEIDASLLRHISDFAEIIENRYDKGPSKNLSILQLKILSVIYNTPDLLPMQQLATSVGIKTPSATVIISKLETEGFVTRRAHPDDRRVVLAELTPKGRRIIRQKIERIHEVLGKATADFSEHDLETVKKFFVQFITAAKAPQQ